VDVSLLFLVDAVNSLLVIVDVSLLFLIVLYCGCFLAALFSPVRFSRASLCLGGSLPPAK
jgi:hypothetical protein